MARQLRVRRGTTAEEAPGQDCDTPFEAEGTGSSSVATANKATAAEMKAAKDAAYTQAKEQAQLVCTNDACKQAIFVTYARVGKPEYSSNGKTVSITLIVEFQCSSG